MFDNFFRRHPHQDGVVTATTHKGPRNLQASEWHSLFRVIEDPRTIDYRLPQRSRIGSCRELIVTGLFVLPSADMGVVSPSTYVCLKVNLDRYFEQPVKVLMEAWRGLISPTADIPEAALSDTLAKRIVAFQIATSQHQPPVVVSEHDCVELSYYDVNSAETPGPYRAVIVGFERYPRSA